MNIINGLLFIFTHPLNQKHFMRTLFRIIWWKTNQVFFSSPTIVQLTDRIQCICYPQLSYSGLIVYTKWPDFAEWNFLLQYLQRNHIFIDIGAHTGDYSLLAADRITHGSIFSFEPEPNVLQYLKQNVAINSLEKIITVIPKAVSNKKGKVSFTLNTHSETSHLTQSNETQAQSSIETSTTTLDIFAKENALVKIDVLKVDVEGAEGLVLEGAKELLIKQQIDVILFEINPHSKDYGFTSNEVISLLISNRYELYSFETPTRLIPVAKDLHLSQTKNLIALNQKTLKHALVKKYLKS